MVRWNRSACARFTTTKSEMGCDRIERSISVVNVKEWRSDLWQDIQKRRKDKVYATARSASSRQKHLGGRTEEGRWGTNKKENWKRSYAILTTGKTVVGLPLRKTKGLSETYCKTRRYLKRETWNGLNTFITPLQVYRASIHHGSDIYFN